jgi:hypothetical protein
MPQYRTASGQAATPKADLRKFYYIDQTLPRLGTGIA